ncbi:hypothetical protein ACFX15_013584 [Malus domestica]
MRGWVQCRLAVFHAARLLSSSVYLNLGMLRVCVTLIELSLEWCNVHHIIIHVKIVYLGDRNQMKFDCGVMFVVNEFPSSIFFFIKVPPDILFGS